MSPGSLLTPTGLRSFGHERLPLANLDCAQILRFRKISVVVTNDHNHVLGSVESAPHFGQPRSSTPYFVLTTLNKYLDQKPNIQSGRVQLY